MISILSQSGHTTYNLKEYVCDTAKDINSLPIDIATGSSAFIIENGKKYMLNSKKEWKVLPSITSGGSGGDTSALEQELENTKQELENTKQELNKVKNQAETNKTELENSQNSLKQANEKIDALEKEIKELKKIINQPIVENNVLTIPNATISDDTLILPEGIETKVVDDTLIIGG